MARPVQAVKVTWAKGEEHVLAGPWHSGPGAGIPRSTLVQDSHRSPSCAVPIGPKHSVRMRDHCGSHLPFLHDMSSGPDSSVCERKARIPKRGRCAATAFGSDNNLSHV